MVIGLHDGKTVSACGLGQTPVESRSSDEVCHLCAGVGIVLGKASRYSPPTGMLDIQVVEVAVVALIILPR